MSSSRTNRVVNTTSQTSQTSPTSHLLFNSMRTRTLLPRHSFKVLSLTCPKTIKILSRRRHIWLAIWWCTVRIIRHCYYSNTSKLCYTTNSFSLARLASLHSSSEAGLPHLAIMLSQVSTSFLAHLASRPPQTQTQTLNRLINRQWPEVVYKLLTIRQQARRIKANLREHLRGDPRKMPHR